jgi:hypothetical protein
MVPELVFPRLRFVAADVRRLMTTATAVPCAVMWVVDQGSYLTTEVRCAPPVQIFAEGLNPSQDPHWQDRLVMLVGEDAFRERIAVAELDAAFALFPDATTLVMEIHQDVIEIVLVGPAAAQGDEPTHSAGAHPQ